MNKMSVAQLLEKREFSFAQAPPPEEVVCRIEFQTIGSLGDYTLITGRPKAGKTKYLAGAMAAAVTRQEVFGINIRLPDTKRTVIHFDTEQGKRSHYNVLKLMLQLANLDVMPLYFKSYHCRQDSGQEIIQMIDYALQSNPETGILFLDGLIDLIDSFNDEKNSKSLINWIKKITEAHNIFIMAILHRSMSVDKSIGHLGSIADRSAQSVLIVEKNKETKQYILKSEYLRDSDDFTPIAIYYNKQLNLWEQTEYIESVQIKPQNNKRKAFEYSLAEHTAFTFRIFTVENILSYEMILQRIREVYGVGRNWAIDCVKILEKENLIWRIAEGFTNIRQSKMFKIT